MRSPTHEYFGFTRESPSSGTLTRQNYAFLRDAFIGLKHGAPGTGGVLDPTVLRYMNAAEILAVASGIAVAGYFRNTSVVEVPEKLFSGLARAGFDQHGQSLMGVHNAIGRQFKTHRGSLQRKMIKYVEECNQQIKQGAEVTFTWMKREEALQDPELVKLANVLPPNIKELRIVTIGTP